jgi:5-methylcytosine-specific restriction endonuclease McrA
MEDVSYCDALPLDRLPERYMDPASVRVCKRCGMTKQATHFVSVMRRGRFNIGITCYACRNARVTRLNAQSLDPAPLSPKLRFSLFKRDSYRCQICGRAAKDGIQLVIDHKIPASKGGQTVEENLWTLCYDCNAGKGLDDV